MKAIVAACMIALAASPVLAQDAAPKIDDAKVAVATRILEETHAQDTMSKMVDLLIPTMIARLRQRSPNLTDDQTKIISDNLSEEMKASMPKMAAVQARVWAEHFSLDELKQIESFYQTPLGQKLIVENPKIAAEILPLGMAVGREAAQQAMEHIVEKLRSQGVKI